MSGQERFGYMYGASKYTPPLGYSSVQVFLSADEAGWYFATQSATFPVVDDKVIQLDVVQPWPSGQRTYRVAPGRFYLQAHDGDFVEGFTLGGNLVIEQEQGYTRCQITSTAPLFDLEDYSGLGEILAPQFEAELARLRADWPGSDDEFDRQVARVEPLSLFVASLNLSDSHIQRQPTLSTDGYLVDTRGVLLHAIRVLKAAGDWPDQPPTLRSLILKQ